MADLIVRAIFVAITEAATDCVLAEPSRTAVLVFDARAHGIRHAAQSLDEVRVRSAIATGNHRGAIGPLSTDALSTGRLVPESAASPTRFRIGQATEARLSFPDTDHVLRTEARAYADEVSEAVLIGRALLLATEQQSDQQTRGEQR
jgi:hypothetical protein